MTDDRWIEVTASQLDHEREGLEYLRERVPPHSPFRVWTNFEFRSTRPPLTTRSRSGEA